jgi:hypothetical protein
MGKPFIIIIIIIINFSAACDFIATSPFVGREGEWRSCCW